MSERYFGTARTEIFPHLPSRIERLLDVGCGTGATVAAIREAHGTASLWAGGVEVDTGSAEIARRHCDHVWSGAVEDADIESLVDAGSLDVILCLDVLEHLLDPWSVVRRLSPLLTPGGRLIVSVPNIRNWKFLWRLAFRGDFHYRDAGLLDRTHLRFFVRPTAVELAICGGLALRFAGNAHPYRSPDIRWFLSRVTGGRLEDLMMKQIVIVAERVG